MQVVYRLASVVPRVHDQTKTRLANPFLLRNLTGLENEVTEEALVFGHHLRQGTNLLLGYQDNVHACLRIDVPKSQAEIVLVDDIGRYFSIDDLRENGHMRTRFNFLSHRRADRHAAWALQDAYLAQAPL